MMMRTTPVAWLCRLCGNVISPSEMHARGVGDMVCLIIDREKARALWHAGVVEASGKETADGLREVVG